MDIIKRIVWFVVGIGFLAIAFHAAEALSNKTHNDLYLQDDRISEGEKGYDLEIYDGGRVALVFAFPDELVRHSGPKTPDAPEGWRFERTIETLTYCSLKEAVDIFLSEINRNCPDFKIIDGRNDPSEPRHFTINIHDPEGDLKAIEVVFIGNRADVTIHNGYLTTGNTDAFLSALKAAIQHKKIVEG